MKNLELGMKVKAHRGQCIGMLIESTEWTGEIVKINKKSIIVEMNHMVAKFGEKVKYDGKYSKKVKYTYWKTCTDGRVVYKSEGRIYGIITF